MPPYFTSGVTHIWCQIRADVLRMAIRDVGVLGAALMAGAGIGVFSTLSAAVKTFVAVDRIFEPDLTQSERHKNGFEKYKMLYQQLVPLHAPVR